MAAKKKKVAERGMRGTRAVKGLVKGTQERVQRALGLIAGGGYDTNNLLDDAMEQWTDVVDAVLRPTQSSAVPSVFFISNNQLPPPKTVALSETVQAGLIRLTELAGIFRGNANAPTAELIAHTNNTGCRLRDPDTDAVIGGGDPQELDEVVVEVMGMPNSAGIYRGVLYTGFVSVLAEVILIRV